MRRLKAAAEFQALINIIKKLDRKVVAVFISVAVLQTIAYYFTSRIFFRQYFMPRMIDNPNVYVYEFFYWFLGDFIALFLLPLLIIKFILKEKIKNFGLRPGDYPAGLKYSLLLLAVMIPFTWFVSAEPDFVRTYPLLAGARDSWNVFLIYEAGLLIFMLAWEFIWRGFMLFGLEEKFGYYAVLMQMIPFLILHDGKPPLETFGAIIGGLVLGALALRTRSVYYCVIIHAGVMFSIDLFSTLRYRAEDFGIGINSLVHVIKHL